LCDELTPEIRTIEFGVDNVDEVQRVSVGFDAAPALTARLTGTIIDTIITIIDTIITIIDTVILTNYTNDAYTCNST
jgi:hypothetical protein